MLGEVLVFPVETTQSPPQSSREQEKKHSHLTVLPVVACRQPDVMCMRPVALKWNLTQGKPKQLKQKQPKLKETLMYYVLRPLYTLLRPPFSVFWPLQNASLHDLHKTVMLSCHKSIANVVHLWHTKNYRKSIPITRTRTRTKTRTCKRQLC